MNYSRDMSILVLTTGGTMGSLPYPDPRHAPPNSTMPPWPQDFVRDALEKDFAAFDTRYMALKPVDSKDMDDDYRANTLSLIRQVPESKIILTHGTDTLLKTADFFHRNLGGDKTILITGSMIPLANGEGSDGYANLEYALTCLQNPSQKCGRANIVLSDYDAQGSWVPKFYVYEPDVYQKLYDPDPRFSRLIRSS